MSCLKLAAITRFILLAGWILAIVWLSLTPVPPTPNISLFGFDKVLHAAAYCALTLLAGWALSGVTALSRRYWIMIALFALFTGGMLEISQALFTTCRKAEFADMVANGIGTSVALLVAGIVRRFRVARH